MEIKALSPYIKYDDADAALDWMEQVLGFTGTVRWPDESGRTYEADIYAGQTKVGVSSGGVPDGTERALFIVHVEDVDAHYERIRAATRETHLDPPQDQPYGPRTFTITDPWGYQWNFWQGEATPPQ